jgi:hypothetical protein
MLRDCKNMSAVKHTVYCSKIDYCQKEQARAKKAERYNMSTTTG